MVSSDITVIRTSSGTYVNDKEIKAGVLNVVESNKDVIKVNDNLITIDWVVDSARGVVVYISIKPTIKNIDGVVIYDLIAQGLY